LLAEHEDAFGRALLDQFEGRDAVVIVEREDGLVETESTAWYFSSPRKWHASERRALRYVQGRALDVGCGAGRVAVPLQERGHEVVGIDVSPLAVEISRRRGVRDVRLLPLTQVDSSLGRFDTILMLGNNFGLFANPKRARWMLRRLKRLTTERARILAVSHDVHATDEAHHLAYHERNRRRGRLAGEIRLRVRYRTYATPWVDYLMVSPAEMEEIVNGTGWRLQEVFRDEVFFAGVIERD
jgi:SAM-dependent methyltransferase